jgi:hypothetical protein
MVIETFERGMSGFRPPTVRREAAEIICWRDFGATPKEIVGGQDIGVALVYRVLIAAR